jgi:MFS family permease
MPPPPAVAAPSSVLRHPAFQRLLVARVSSTLAVQAEAVTIGWLVYTVARAQHLSVKQGAFLVGMVGLAQFLPLFALTLPAGQVADRRDRRRVVQLCLLVLIACDLALAALALHPRPSLTPVFVVAAVFGGARAFLQPASNALTPMLVPRAELPRAIAIGSLGFQAASVIGPWVGGALCAVAPSAAFGAAAGFYALALVALQLIRADTRPTPHAGSALEMIGEGLSYVWREKIVFGAISLDLFAVLLGGAVALLPVFAEDILKVGAHGFGVLRSGPAIGAALVAAWLGRRPIQRHAGRWMFVAVAVFGLATLGFAVSRRLWLSVLALAVLGGADMVSVYVRQSLVQIVTPDAMRGRVAAVSTLFIGASNELGEFETGLVARVLGPVGAALFGGVGSLVVTGLWSQLFPALRRADRLAAPEPAAPPPSLAEPTAPERAPAA